MSLTKFKTCLAVAGLALAAALPASAEVRVGEPLPDLAIYGLDGQLPNLSGKVVLVDFWATWCAPCKASFPVYSDLQRELGAQGFVLLAVSVDKHPGEYASFVHKFSPSFATVRDASQQMVADFRVPGMPTSYLIDRHGVLRSIHTGFHGEGTAQELRAEIIKLLGEGL